MKWGDVDQGVQSFNYVSSGSLMYSMVAVGNNIMLWQMNLFIKQTDLETENKLIVIKGERWGEKGKTRVGA